MDAGTLSKGRSAWDVSSPALDCSKYSGVLGPRQTVRPRPKMNKERDCDIEVAAPNLILDSLLSGR